ncbi:Dynein light chain [Giardia duodenalis]|uniref:Dynein light chain LC4 n=4 Tax=Giardia intestinalis TaxID=5741 RepID=A0A644EXS6_GIAIC|nr:Dynein light chain LC4 [Giardia intestinalis]EET02079.1 Dynein light chain [Giardia intestinalis ATCC 50581]EFO61003.1 Dynein light chain [Giardia lamblia P15]ESU35220.1 Dynein light chain [Giardia intestinalis]ESU45771.1 Dynein light chain [Giardia intestinalis]KAE8301241.1 Dynein light chain LC4 [Giardia intestinalis]
MSDDEDNFLSSINYPLVVECDMNEEERAEATETIVTAVEKFPSDPEQAARFIKESLDRKFGQYFHVCVGNSFGYSIDTVVGHKLAMAYGMTGVVVFKAS